MGGLKQRDGAGVLQLFPVKLAPPGSAPPPESEKEILGSSLLHRVDAKKPSVIFSDGAAAWPKATKKVHGKKVKHAAVSHKNSQFTARLRKKPVGGSRTAGTVH